jgi:3(or 17)beta-hydroxysteroid dehydrogenase
MGRVQGKVALITGGASGLGAASAKLLAREGASVAITDLNDEAGRALCAELTAGGAQAAYYHHDVTHEAHWLALMPTVLRKFGRLDIMLNNAGVAGGPRTFPSDTTLEHWRAVMSVNLDGVFLGTKHAIAAMKSCDPVKGSIINISSIMGIVGLPGIDAYNASKGGVRIYTKSVALSCAEQKLAIRVNSVHPGFIDTPMVRASIKARFNDFDEGMRAANTLAPVGFLGQPEDIAYGVLYLASDESRFVTGSELVIDGGYTAR